MSLRDAGRAPVDAGARADDALFVLVRSLARLGGTEVFAHTVTEAARCLEEDPEATGVNPKQS